MTLCVALLRALNVGGSNRVTMAALREAVTALGFGQVRTLLQTGNIVFDAQAADGLEAMLEAGLERSIGLKVAVCVRTAPEWWAALDDNPFPEAARDDPSHLLVMALKAVPEAGAEAALRSRIPGRERAALVGRQAYLVYPDGIGRSRLTPAVIERALGTRGTARNWNTCLSLAAMLDEAAGLSPPA